MTIALINPQLLCLPEQDLQEIELPNIPPLMVEAFVDPPLGKELLAVDVYWARGKHFSLELWATGICPCSCEWSHIHVHV